MNCLPPLIIDELSEPIPEVCAFIDRWRRTSVLFLTRRKELFLALPEVRREELFWLRPSSLISRVRPPSFLDLVDLERVAGLGTERRKPFAIKIWPAMAGSTEIRELTLADEGAVAMLDI